KLGYIDTLIENIAVALSEYKIAKGYIKSIIVNVISTFLLAILILSKIYKKAKLENIKDNLIKGIDIKDFIFSTILIPLSSYPFSKLTEIFVSHYLAYKVVPFEKTSVILNLVYLGFYVTNLVYNALLDIK
ncbi:uncharacterized protein THITE_49836, partial [Thermothielavioides terrestris NRRL 8126]